MRSDYIVRWHGAGADTTDRALITDNNTGANSGTNTMEYNDQSGLFESRDAATIV